MVDVGQGFEVATGEWVLSISSGKERYSVPVSQGIDLTVVAEDLRKLVIGASWDRRKEYHRNNVCNKKLQMGRKSNTDQDIVHTGTQLRV